MAWPCLEPNNNVCKISKSSVPWSKSTGGCLSFGFGIVPLVEYLPEYPLALVECQGERSHGRVLSIDIARQQKAMEVKTDSRSLRFRAVLALLRGSRQVKP